MDKGLPHERNVQFRMRLESEDQVKEWLKKLAGTEWRVRKTPKKTHCVVYKVSVCLASNMGTSDLLHRANYGTPNTVLHLGDRSDGECVYGYTNMIN